MNQPIRQGVAAALSLLLVAPAHAVAGNVSYTTIDYGQGSTGTVVSGVNAAGMITGWYAGVEGYDHGFVWSAGNFISFDAAPGGTTLPAAINGAGQVVENFIPNGGGNRMGFLREPNGVQHKLPFPAEVSVNINGINRYGAIVGETTDGSNASPIGFLLVGHTVTHLLPSGATTSTADAINEWGSVTGSFINAAGPGGYVYKAGSYTIFRAPNQDSPQPSSIDEAGLVSGSVLYVTDNGLSAVERGFTFGSSGFRSFAPTWSLNTFISKAFSPGYFVGTMETPESYKAFLYRNGLGIGLLPPGAATGYGVGGTAAGIVVGNYWDTADVIHGFMATVP